MPDACLSLRNTSTTASNPTGNKALNPCAGTSITKDDALKALHRENQRISVDKQCAVMSN
jgi:hypothetical protein